MTTNSPARAGRRTAAGLVALVAVVALASPGPAGADGGPQAAGGRPTDVLFIGGGGITTVDAHGNVVLDGGQALVNDRHLRELLDATLSVVLSPSDGSLPAADACEPAASTFVLDGTRDVPLTLEGAGTVCAVRNPLAPSFVSQRFEGTYVITEARRPGLEGDDGLFSVTVTSETGAGFTSASATSFIPEAA